MLLKLIFNVLLRNVPYGHTHACTTSGLLGLLSEPKSSIFLKSWPLYTSLTPATVPAVALMRSHLSRLLPPLVRAVLSDHEVGHPGLEGNTLRQYSQLLSTGTTEIRTGDR